MEEELVTRAGLPLETVPMRGVQDEVWHNLPLLWAVPASVARARSLIGHFQPDVVFGTGGYVVAAVGIAAATRRKPLVLQLPDAVPGRTVKLLAGRARAVCTAFESSAGRLPRARVLLTGTPLRPEFEESALRARQGAMSRPDVPRRIVVFGGSQGARRINTAVAEALKTLLEDPARTVHHVCGQLDYKQLNLMRSVLPTDLQRRYTVEAFNPEFFHVLQGADVVIARAGGSAIAEMSALGVPMILVPYPYAGGHQRFNAEPLARSGAALVVPDEELSGVRLVEEVRRLSAPPQNAGPNPLTRMARASLAFGRPDAADAVARAVLDAAP
jgi:UDP-N-acetylglucosamine--N-acetylmuramyl-(pentapeptide) pyrophosphoryl-undecaprenol N-acetylglucosamine transferase